MNAEKELQPIIPITYIDWPLYCVAITSHRGGRVGGMCVCVCGGGGSTLFWMESLCQCVSSSFGGNGHCVDAIIIYIYIV